MTIKMVNLWHPLKLVLRTKKICYIAATLSYKIVFLKKNKIVYLMQKDGLVYPFSS